MKKNKTNHHSVASLAASFSLAAIFTITTAGAQTDDPADDAFDRQYRQAIEGELFQEAADLAKGRINALLGDSDPDKEEWGEALSHLGYAQHHAGEYLAAIENYRLAVEVLEDEFDRLHGSLAEPLLGLSRAQTAAGEFGDAVNSYDRLLHVQQVNEGPHTMAQADAVAELSTVYYYLGNSERANALQQAYVSIFRQNHPDNYIAQLPAQYSRAQMLQRTGRILDSQNAYRRIIANIEKADTSRSLHLLPAIYQLADVYQQNRVVDGTDGSRKARRYLRRAVHIAQNHKDATPLDIADAHIAYGDYLMVQTVDRRAAWRQYTEAWTLLSADPSYGSALADRFGRPVPLNAIPSQSTEAMRKLMTLAQSIEDESAARLAVRYDVGADGRTNDIAVIEGDPTGYWDSIVVNHLSNLVFRPAIIDGKATEFSDHLYEIRFSSPDQELPDELRQNGLTKQASYQE